MRCFSQRNHVLPHLPNLCPTLPSVRFLLSKAKAWVHTEDMTTYNFVH